MKKITLKFPHQACVLLLLMAAAPWVAAQNPPASAAPPTGAPGADPAPPPTPEQASYLFGLTFGTQIHATGITNELAMDSIVRGLKDGLQGKQTTPADQQQIRAYLRVVSQAVVARNQEAAKEFLEHNAHEKGVITTASGLQYRIIAAGDPKAASIAPTDKVTVDYRGKLIDGSEFDSSYARGMPASFPVSGVIKGWQEALVLMKPGAKWQLFIPPELAYGAGTRPKIPPGSLLIFDVNVLSIDSKPAPAIAAPVRPATPGKNPAGVPKPLDQ